MVYETDRNCCKECGSICFASGACTSCGWIPTALLATARAEGWTQALAAAVRSVGEMVASPSWLNADPTWTRARDSAMRAIRSAETEGPDRNAQGPVASLAAARATAIARGIVEEQLPVILGCAVIGGDLEGARAVLIERIAQAIERAGGGR